MILIAPYLGVFLAFAGCVALFQAGQRRTQFAAVRNSPGTQAGLRRTGAVLIIVSLVLFSVTSGLELGIPIWLGVLSGAGGLALILDALKPEWQPLSVVAVGLVCLALLITSFVSRGAL
ncbi:MAG: DUF3325 family protein [Pseudomonadota bacterium]